MRQSAAAEYRLALLLRVMGGVCLLALVPLWMPRAWIVAGHRWVGWGPFPDGPVAEYLARSVSALSAFYGGLLVVLATAVRRYAPVSRYQAAAIMLLSASGVVVGCWAEMPLWFVGGDAVGCWAYCVVTLLLVRRVERSHAEQSIAQTGHAANGSSERHPSSRVSRLPSLLPRQHFSIWREVFSGSSAKSPDAGHGGHAG